MTNFIHKIKNISFIKTFFWGIINMALLTPVLTNAETGVVTGRSPELDNPLGPNTNSFADLVTKIADIVFKIGFPIAVIFIIYSGFLFVTARGNEEGLKKAKSTFMWAVIGTAILLGAKIIAMAIESTVNSL